MIYTQEKLLNYLQAQNIDYKLFEHAPLRTCEDALEVAATFNIPGTGIKNLFLKDNHKNFYLISANSTTKINLKETGKAYNIKGLRFADAILLKQHLEVQPGSVTPLALINDRTKSVTMILDSHVLEQKHIQIHPLQNNATIVITPDDLLIFFKSTNRSYGVYNFDTNEIVS